jgi:hypothetical protein
MYTAEPLIPDSRLGEVGISAARFTIFIFQQN